MRKKSKQGDCKAFVVDSLEKSERVTEALQYHGTKEKIDYVAYYYPEFLKLTHVRMGYYLGKQRETVTRALRE